MAILFKGLNSDDIIGSDTADLQPEMLHKGNFLNPDFLCINLPNKLYQHRTHYMESDDVLTIPITGTGMKSSAAATFLTVNPYSENLDAVLGYISALCRHLLGSAHSYMFSDMTAYSNSAYVKSLYSVYSDSYIDFNVPYEVFWEDFEEYLRNKLSLDDMIENIDMKLSMYRNE